MPKNKWRAARIVLCALASMGPLGAILSAPAQATGLFAPDAIGLTGGYSSNVAIYGVALSWDLPGLDTAATANGFGARVDAQLAYWRSQERPTPNPFLWDASLTPMLRWASPAQSGPRFFVEGGIGIHLLSHTRINNDRNFTTAFQFGELGGIGFSFGPAGEYELGVYVEHVSNADIKKPNDGLTYPGIVLRAILR